MPEIKLKADALLFSYETTYKTDYRSYDIKPPVFTVYQKKPGVDRPKVPLTKNVYTLTELRDEVPFSLLHGRKAILRTNPWKVQQKYEKLPDLLKEEVQKTRPRLVLTPAVSMDDIDDPNARKILCRDMYTTDTARALREALIPRVNIEPPLLGLPTPSNPVFHGRDPDTTLVAMTWSIHSRNVVSGATIILLKLQPPYVSPEWRMKSTSWDNKQLRAHCDPTQKFWLSREPKCRACDEYVTITKQRKMLRQMKSNIN